MKHSRSGQTISEQLARIFVKYFTEIFAEPVTFSFTYCFINIPQTEILNSLPLILIIHNTRNNRRQLEHFGRKISHVRDDEDENGSHGLYFVRIFCEYTDNDSEEETDKRLEHELSWCGKTYATERNDKEAAHACHIINGDHIFRTYFSESLEDLVKHLQA